MAGVINLESRRLPGAVRQELKKAAAYGVDPAEIKDVRELALMIINSFSREKDALSRATTHEEIEKIIDVCRSMEGLITKRREIITEKFPETAAVLSGFGEAFAYLANEASKRGREILEVQ